MRQVVVALLMIAVGLAGCSADPEPTVVECEVQTNDGITESNGDCPDEKPAQAGDEPPAGGDSSDAGDGSDPGSQGGPGDDNATAINTAPVGQMTADHLQGTVGVTITFTVNATDADGDALSWNLTMGGDALAEGTTNATVSHTFDEEGTFTITLNVTDGQAYNVTSRQVVIEAAEPTGPCGAEPEPCIVDGNAWVAVWSDGRCDAKGRVVGHDLAIWIHDRPGGPTGELPFLGGGTWLFEESNGITGLQLTQTPSLVEDAKDPLAVQFNCQGGDTLIL